MSITRYPIDQTDPPRSAQETLPTMYDLPSENAEESGLLDEFHLWQSELCSATFCPPSYVFDRYTDELQGFQLEGDRYKKLELNEPRVWIPSLGMGLGLWQGEYRGCDRF